MIDVSKFVKNHTPLCVCTLGIAILGYLGYHIVRWIINKCHKTEKIDQVAKKNICSASSKEVFPIHPHSSSSQSIDSHRSVNNGHIDETALKQEAEVKKAFAVTKIQRAYRGHAARLALKKLQAEKLEKQKAAATIRMQSIWRGHAARVKAEKARRHLLSYALFEKAKFYVDSPSGLQGVPQAPNGKTHVYLPKGLPIVLKQSGSPANQKRFDQMKQGREICDQGSYKNLVIPRARVYANFIIESRLPITMHGTKEQMGLYIENRERFTVAVKEFTGFLCQSELDDIRGSCYDPYERLAKFSMGRYDNIVLYLEKEEGKIGLVDLERFKPECSKESKEWCLSKCLDAVCLFPYHLDEIMSVAKGFDPNIEAYREHLEVVRDDALKRFKLAYEDHLDFVNKKGITVQNPIAFEKLKATRIEQLKKAIEEKLRKEHENVFYKGCLGEDPDQTMTCFNEKAFPQILNATYKLINSILEDNMECHGGKKSVSSNPELLSVRTLIFCDSYSMHDGYKEFVDSISLDMLSFKKRGLFGKNSFLFLLLDTIFKELEKGKEIAYYNPSWYGASERCVFC